MFTGIVEEVGKILEIDTSFSGKITIECSTVTKDSKTGDSIAVNGVCLTVTELLKNGFSAKVSPETFSISSLSNLKTGNLVNLERAMKADGRFGGHIVSGHIDGKGKFIASEKKGDFYELYFELKPEQIKYTVKKGSITIDGIS